MSSTTLPLTEQLADAARFIHEGDHFLVVSHVNPDGDAISSTLAVGEILKQLGKSFILINDARVPDKFSFLSNGRIIVDASTRPALSFDRVIAVDCADYERVGRVKDLIAADVPLLNIDHHSTNNAYGASQLISPDAAATAEVLYHLVKTLGLAWNKDLASFIYTGLLTDTGGFRYANTSPSVMRIAAEMLDYGISGPDIAERLLERLTMTQMLLLKRALGSLSFGLMGQVCWLSVSYEEAQELQVSSEDMEGLVNYPRNIEGVEVGLLFKEVAPGRFKVSMRSAGKVNVAELALSFGGGGHVRASGCTITGSLDEVVHQVLMKLEKTLS